MSIFDKLTSPEARAFVAKVEQPFLGLPHLPEGVINFLVSIAPYMAAIGGVLMFIAVPFQALVTGLGLLTLNPLFAVVMIVGAAISLVSAILLIMAYKPLKARQMTGWYYMFWVQVMSIVSSVLMIVGDSGRGVVGLILGALIGMYILFEMKRGYSELL